MEVGIRLISKQLDRPSEKNRVEYNHGDRNLIKGKFGQGKERYGMDRIKARLKDTSESWLAMMLVIMNGVRQVKESPYFWLPSIFSFMADLIRKIMRGIYMIKQPSFLFAEYRYRLFQ
jgi:IS5 family transposase